jgi:hypothetical protein
MKRFNDSLLLAPSFADIKGLPTFQLWLAYLIAEMEILWCVHLGEIRHDGLHVEDSLFQRLEVEDLRLLYLGGQAPTLIVWIIMRLNNRI